VDLDPLVRVSKRGLPATGEVLDNTRPLLGRLDPWLRNLTPITDYLGLYRRELVAFFANFAAATQATEGAFNDPSRFIHYLRAASPVNPEMMTGFPFRLSTNRSNPYTEPGGYDKLRTEGHLEVFGSYLCTDNPVPEPPAPNEWISEDVAAQIVRFVFGGDQNRGKAPPCDPQAPLGRFVGQTGLFPRLQPLP
jgi:phospholipid/cholesterol/gamma-HCH transport system substrate-binding protein